MPDKRIAIFGNPGTPDHPAAGWYSKYMISVLTPFQMVNAYTGKAVGSIPFHRRGADKLLAALTTVLIEAKQRVKESLDYADARKAVKERYGYDHDTDFYDQHMATYLHDAALKMIHAFGGDIFGGSYVLRAMRGSTKLSCHAWGIAVDIDPARNPLGARSSTFPDWYIDCFERHGFTWGGRWQRPDPMHFELQY